MYRTLSAFLAGLLFLCISMISCTKETSVETDFVINPATGTVSGSSVFSFGGSTGSCPSAVINGSFVMGTALTPANTVTVSVNVTTIGTYAVSTATVNGVHFSGSGSFTATGTQTIMLTGSGTPLAAGSFTYQPGTTGCSFSVTVTTTVVPPAAFTLTAAAGACTGYVVAGSYTQNIPMSASNTVTLTANVTVLGSYSLSTNTASGITYNASGSFTALGPNVIVLTATGTPTAAGTLSFTPTVAGACAFSVIVQPPAPPASFTLSGAPGACTAPNILGVYTATLPLGTSNTVEVQVNVTVAGAYTLSTNTVNGMTFSKSGVFTTTGVQTVTLQGTGTPLTSTTSVFTPQIGTSSCTFSIVVDVAPPPPSGTFTCKIDGVFTTFNYSSYAQVSYNVFGTIETDLVITGRRLPLGNPSDDFHLYLSKSNGGAIPTGTYNYNSFMNTAGVYSCGMENYIDATSTHWSVGDNTPFSPNPAFTINIATITTARYTGTFSGTLKEAFGTLPGLKVITEGVFDVPLIP